MTWIVGGLALLAGSVIVSYRVRRNYAQRSFVDECAEFGCYCPDEVEPPLWMLMDGGQPMYERFIEAVHFAQWEEQMGIKR